MARTPSAMVVVESESTTCSSGSYQVGLGGGGSGFGRAGLILQWMGRLEFRQREPGGEARKGSGLAGSSIKDEVGMGRGENEGERVSE